MTPNDFLLALQDQNVIEQLQKVLEPIIVLSVKALLKPLDDRISELSGNLKKLQSDAILRNAKIDDFKTEIDALSCKLKKTETALDAAEQYSRRDNLIFSGVPSNMADIAGSGDRNADHSAATVEAILDLCNNVLMVPASSDDISVAHRLRQRHINEAVRLLRRVVLHLLC